MAEIKTLHLQIGPEAAGSLVQLIDQRVQAVMLSMRRDGGMLSG
nr:phage tail tape measure protein [Escherichia coli]